MSLFRDVTRHVTSWYLGGNALKISNGITLILNLILKPNLSLERPPIHTHLVVLNIGMYHGSWVVGQQSRWRVYWLLCSLRSCGIWPVSSSHFDYWWIGGHPRRGTETVWLPLVAGWNIVVVSCTESHGDMLSTSQHVVSQAASHDQRDVGKVYYRSYNVYRWMDGVRRVHVEVDCDMLLSEWKFSDTSRLTWRFHGISPLGVGLAVTSRTLPVI